MALGSVSISAADNGKWVGVVFDANGLAYLNDWIGYSVVLGGAITSIESEADVEYAFAYNGERGLLTLTVPEPAGLPWLLAALLALAARREAHGS